MNKKALFLYTICLMTVSAQIVPVLNQGSPAIAQTNSGIYRIEELVDITPKHWAYNAVKYVTEDLGIMEPKTPTRFVGDRTATRYELAHAFYLAAKSLERISGKSLSLNEGGTPITITDVNIANQEVVNSVVNTYGLMQLMPDSKFMGNREMTRYELAFDLNNYLMLLERKFGQTNFPERDRLSELKDVSSQHWAYPAIKNIVDKYRIMDGYPQNVYGGDQKLTRYEVAALLRRFVDLVDTRIIRPAPAPTPTATPTPEPTPTPTPTPVPTPEPTPTPVPVNASSVDLKVGGSLNSLFSASMTNTSPYRIEPGFNFDGTVWFSPSIGGKIDMEYLLSDFHGGTEIDPRFGFSPSVQWRLLGMESDDALSLRLGLGYTYNQWFGTGTVGHGPRAEFGIEFPAHPYVSIFLQDAFTYYIQPGWRNDLFAGINIPAANMFSFQLGYAETRYSLQNGTTVFGNSQNGIRANFRLRLK